jgi:anti-anti-sigma factor
VERTLETSRSDWMDSHVNATIEADGSKVVELHGDIDLAVVEPLRDCMISGVEKGLHILVDLADVTLIDCACLGALVQAGDLAGRRGQALCLVAPPPVVRRTLAAAGLDTAFPTFGDRRQALRESMLEPCVAA